MNFYGNIKKSRKSLKQAMPTSFENEAMGWLADGGHNQAQIFYVSAPLNQLR